MPSVAVWGDQRGSRVRAKLNESGLHPVDPCDKHAERQGFEPWVPFLVQLLSRQLPSATRPPLRAEKRGSHSRVCLKHQQAC